MGNAMVLVAPHRGCHRRHHLVAHGREQEIGPTPRWTKIPHGGFLAER